MAPRIKDRHRLVNVGKRIADLTRATGINYARLVGAMNGYWDLREDENKKIEHAFAKWESEAKAA